MATDPQISQDLLASHMPTDVPFAVSHAPAEPPSPSIQMDPDASPHDKLMQGLNQGGVPLVAPDGHPGFVHRDTLNTFLGKNPGYKTGAVVTAPDGHPGIVPHDSLGAFLKSNPTYKLGQATPQTDAVLQDPRMGESRMDMLKRTVAEPFKQEMEPKSAWEEIKRDIARGLNPLSNPVVQAAGNLVTEGGQKLSDLIAHEWEGVPTDTTIGKLGKNYLAPAAETAATGVLAPMAQPESIATMGAFKAPLAGAAGRLIRAGSGLAFGVPALRAAVRSGAPAVQAAAQGNTPEAVRLGTQAAFDTAMAAETLGGVAREAPATAKETAQLATNKAPYWLAKRLPESLLTPAKQVAVDVRQTQDQGANLAAGLETGGSPTSKSVQTYEDVAQPILPDIRAEAARQGVTEKDFEGRKGYDTAKKVTAGVRESYDDAYNSLLDPLRGDYAGEAARRAAGEVVNKMLGDSTLMDEIQKGDPSGRNVQALRNLRDSIANVRTVGQLDDMRQALNRLSGKYETRSEGQQYLSPLTQETLHEGANSIRNALYGEMERLYGGASTPTEVNQGQVQNPAVQSGVTESQIRELQRNHGAAIQADDLMQQTARNLSSQASSESALPNWWQRVRGNAAPLEIAGRPKMAATGFMKSVLGFKPPDATEIFNTRMKRVIKGAAPDEGMDFPKGAMTPEYVDGRSEGPTASRVPGLALPAPPPTAESEVVGPRGPRQLEGAGIDQRALPPGAYEQPPSRFTPKPKALPPATLPAENAPRTNRVEAVGVPETAEASALQNRFEQKPQGFAAPKRPFFLKGNAETQPPMESRAAAVKSQTPPAETPATPTVGSPEYEDLKARVAQLEQKQSGKGIVGVLGKKAEVAPAKPEYLNNGFGPKRTSPPQDVEAIKSRIAELEAKKAKPSSPVPALQSAAKSSPAERFRSMADALDKQIDDKRREMTQNATPKRMAQYRSRIIEADELERTQKALRSLADAHEKGTVPPELAGVRSKDEIARMVRKGLSGEGGYYDRIPNRDYHDKSSAGKKLQDMIEGKTPEANAARAEKDRLSKINQAEADAQFRPIPGFFPTPKPIIEKMLSAADIRPGEKVLEPSAGKGDIADAIKQRTPGAELDTAEINGQLANILKLKGHKLVASDFLSEAFDNDKGKYDKIVMNPPFEKGADVDHVRRAYELLKPGGRLVSIMSPHAEFASDKKSVDFRNWLDRVGGTSEKIENGFKGAGVFRQTGVASRMVVIDKE